MHLQNIATNRSAMHSSQQQEPSSSANPSEEQTNSLQSVPTIESPIERAGESGTGTQDKSTNQQTSEAHAGIIDGDFLTRFFQLTAEEQNRLSCDPHAIMQLILDS